LRQAVLTDSGRGVRRPPRSGNDAYWTPAWRRAAASRSRSNCGCRRDAGKRRTSATAAMACALSRPRKSSIARVECPTVQIVTPSVAGGIIRGVLREPYHICAGSDTVPQQSIRHARRWAAAMLVVVALPPARVYPQTSPLTWQARAAGTQASFRGLSVAHDGTVWV